MTAATRGQEVAHELERDGYSLLPQVVDAETVRSIHTSLEGGAPSERFADHRSGFTIYSIPENVHVTEYAIEHLLKCADIVALTYHPVLLDAATRYLGCKPTKYPHVAKPTHIEDGVWIGTNATALGESGSVAIRLLPREPW